MSIRTPPFENTIKLRNIKNTFNTEKSSHHLKVQISSNLQIQNFQDLSRWRLCISLSISSEAFALYTSNKSEQLCSDTRGI